MTNLISRREAVVVARALRRRGYSPAPRYSALAGQTISDAAVSVAGIAGDRREAAEDIIAAIKFSDSWRGAIR